MWRESGALVLLLDFDGTLAPIVERPEVAAIAPRARDAIERLVSRGAEVAIVSGRGLADARSRVGLSGLGYAGNHGMEIEMEGKRRLHPEARLARPSLDRVVTRLQPRLSEFPGAIVEDKGLTLSIHYRLVDRRKVDEVRKAVRESCADIETLEVTEGKEVLEARPAVDWDKGRAVDFLLDQLKPPPGAPVIYIGDDRTDEDAFRALREVEGGEGVIVGVHDPSATLARAFVETTEEVAELLDLLAAGPAA